MAGYVGKFTMQSTETLDPGVTYEDWFSNRSDAPASHTVTVADGLTLLSSFMVDKVIRAVVTGGVHGQSYKVTTRMTTDAVPPITKEADFLVVIKDV